MSCVGAGWASGPRRRRRSAALLVNLSRAPWENEPWVKREQLLGTALKKLVGASAACGEDWGGAASRRLRHLTEVQTPERLLLNIQQAREPCRLAFQLNQAGLVVEVFGIGKWSF